jgi:preprotein translocase subunit YajC
VDSILLKCCQALPLLADAAKPGAVAAPPGPEWGQLLLPIVAIGALFYFMLIRPQKREQSRRQALLDALKKNDRVVTIGGIYGVVANVQREADEVTLKIDEATNTKIRVTFNAIARVLGDESVENTAAK